MKITPDTYKQMSERTYGLIERLEHSGINGITYTSQLNSTNWTINVPLEEAEKIAGILENIRTGTI